MIMYSPGSFVRLKRFGDTHAPRECVFPPGKISAQIDVILPAEQKANPRATTRQKMVGTELVRSGKYAAQPPKGYNAKPPRKHQPIFQLRSKHVAIQVASRLIAAQFVAYPINAVAVKGRLAACTAEK